VLRNLVKETATNPSNGTLISLGGSPSGYNTFVSAFGSGASAWYAITDGAQTEINSGTITAGSPNTIGRGTPIWTSTGSSSRLTFTGSVTVYNVQPADRTLYADAAGVWQAQTRRMTGLLAATGATDAPRFDQVAWRMLSSQTWSSALSAATFSLPSGYVRFRLEWADVLPAAAVALFWRMSFDGGTTWASATSDYDTALNVTTGSANAPNQYNASGYGVLAGAPAAGWPSHGFFEFSYLGRHGFGQSAFQSTAGASATFAGRCGASAGTSPTNIMIGAVGQNMTQGNARLLGGSL